jgi:glycosyltransferase involved in cell wall biosynthesis
VTTGCPCRSTASADWKAIFDSNHEESSVSEAQTASFPRSLSVVVPVFGGGEDLEELVTRLAAVVEGHTSWELILVNDGSLPGTWDRIRAIADVRPNVRGINLRRNFGQQNALLAGIRATTGDVVVTMDDDLQHPPEEIPWLLERLGDAELVYGTPAVRVRSWRRSVVAALAKAALRTVFGATQARNITAFRAFDGSMRPVFKAYSNPYVSIDVLLSWATTRITAVPVRYDRRRRGTSGYRLWPLMTLTLNMVTGFSVWPLRLASIIGLAVALFGGLVLIFVIWRYLSAETTVPGFAFLASMMAIFAGAQLFGIGIIGEYLARMHFRTMDKPPFVVESTVNCPSPAEDA